MAKSIALAILHQGLVKNHNEDNLYILDAIAPAAHDANFERSAASSANPQLFAVTDGMGGRGIGDVASQAVLRILDQQRRRLRSGTRLDFNAFARDVIDLANRSVCDLLAPYEGLPVGTTFSLLAIDRDTAYTMSLGNSRVYLYRDSQLIHLTEDHIGQLPDRRRLTRYLGFLTEGGMVDVENMTRTVLNRGDILLLTTDGLTDAVSDEQIAAALADPAAFVQQIRHLRDLALRQGGHDNLAVIGIRILDPLAEDKSSATGRHPRLRGIGRGDPYAGPAVKGGAGYLQDSRLRRILRPILFFLAFVLLGLLIGKLAFSMPAWLTLLFG